MQVKKLFVILTWIAVLALPATMVSICIVNCCALRAAMPHCGEMAKIVAQKPLQNAAPAPKIVKTIARVATANLFTTSPLPQRSVSPAHAAPRAESDVGLHILHAALLI